MGKHERTTIASSNREPEQFNAKAFIDDRTEFSPKLVSLLSGPKLFSEE
jgi:hypothetical protein